MGQKMLLVVLVALFGGVLAQEDYLAALAKDPGLLQYLPPILTSEKFIREHGSFAQANTPCSAPQLEYCQKNFADALGQQTDIFSNPVKFATLIRSFYKKDFNATNNGMTTLCSAQISFRNCLGILYTACTDEFNILRKQQAAQKRDLDNARLLAGVYDDIEFDCGGGFTQGYNNWDCIKRINNNALYDRLIPPCFTAFNASFQSDPTTVCAAGQNLSLCVGQAYQTIDRCAQNAVQWWACERVNRHFKLEGYCDTNTCNSLIKSLPAEVANQSFLDFVNNGGLLNEAQHAFIKAAAKKQRRLLGLPQ